ncbi:chemotaxis protein CheX [Cohnella sp.]|uniref:chemotaxis protein CheX n=1 Tax=Cohnella sp. TaxID=1883426 RepID=UPI0035680E25
MSALSENVSGFLGKAVDSIKQVIPIPMTIEAHYLSNETALQTEMCVLVGFAGEIAGRMLIDGSRESFGRLGENMFGMVLEGEMLHSFVGEVANMVAGNICTLISQTGRKVDITPPTVLEGEMKLFGFEKVIFVPLSIDNVGKLHIVLLLQEVEEAA